MLVKFLLDNGLYGSLNLSAFYLIISVYRDPELVRRIGAATALEVRATGIPYVFAPCIAVNSTLLYILSFNSFLFI